MTNPLLVLVVSSVAAAFTACLAAFALFWALLCIVYGGPEGRVGSEAVIVGLISLSIGLALAYVSYLFYRVPQRLAAGATGWFHRLALPAGGVGSVLFAGLLWAVGPHLLGYAVLVVALLLFVRLAGLLLRGR